MSYNRVSKKVIPHVCSVGIMRHTGVICMASRYYTPEQKILSFWNRVAITANDDKCWLWLGASDKRGYGYVRWDNVQTYAHRIAWVLPDYVIPDGMEVCHSCDNPRCCNPKHLWVGTHKDNVQDMIKKGRKHDLKGENHSSNKLSTQQVLEIRELYSSGSITQIEIAKSFGIAQTTVSSIVTKTNWKHIKEGLNDT